MLGFLVAPLVPCIAAAYMVSVMNGDLWAFPVGVLIYSVFAYPFAVILGMPAYLFMSRLGYLSIAQTAAVGAALGLISSFIIIFIFGSGNSRLIDASIIYFLFGYATFGAITAYVFWLISLRPKGISK